MRVPALAGNDGSPRSSVAATAPKSAVVPHAHEADGIRKYELTQSALLAIRERERSWLENQRMSDSLATNGMIAMRKRRAAAARLASAASTREG